MPPARRIQFLLSLAVVLAVAATAEQTALRTPQGVRLHESTAWEAGTQSPAPQRISGGEAAALRFTAPFDARGFPTRATWDIALDADLRRAGALTLAIRVSATDAIRQFTVYLKSGNGWYAGHFMPAGRGEWETVTLAKGDFDIEGLPDGWRRISALRFSIWRAARSPATVEVANFATRSADSRVAVVRGRASGSESMSRDCSRYAGTVLNSLRKRGIDPMLLEQADLTDATALADVQVAILPYNPHIPRAEAESLQAFLNGGGRLVGFYTIPRRLERSLGLRGGEHRSARNVPGGIAGIRFANARSLRAPEFVPQRSWMVQVVEPEPERAETIAEWVDEEGRSTDLPAVLRTPHGYWVTHVLLNQSPEPSGQLLLALCGDLAPSLWLSASFHAIRSWGAALEYGNATETAQALNSRIRAPQQRRELHEALRGLHTARDLHTKRAFAQAVRVARASNQAVERLYARSVPAVDGQIRAIWCASPDASPAESWDDLARRLRRAGFSTVLAYMADAATAQYPSRALRVATTPDGDPVDHLSEATAACRRHGLDLHVWVKAFHVARGTIPPRARRLREHPPYSMSRDGTYNQRWLCPTDPVVRKRLLTAVQELVERGDIAGIHLDYIRYASSSHCVCARCRAAFETKIGREVEDWPNATLRPPLAARWREFRTQRISTIVEDIAERVDDAPGQLALTAAVFSDLHIARNAVGQDWPRWCQQDWLAAVYPMNYEPTVTGFADRVRKQVAALRGSGVPLLPGIGVASRDLSLLDVVRQIDVATRQDLPGFALFQADERTLNTILPALTPHFDETD